MRADRRAVALCPVRLVKRARSENAARWASPSWRACAARAYGAHLNAFETFPPFAAAVIIAHVVEGAERDRSTCLAMLWIVARLAHMGFYLADRQPLRSAAFFVGLVADDRHLRPAGVPLDVTPARNVEDRAGHVGRGAVVEQEGDRLGDFFRPARAAHRRGRRRA